MQYVFNVRVRKQAQFVPSTAGALLQTYGCAIATVHQCCSPWLAIKHVRAVLPVLNVMLQGLPQVAPSQQGLCSRQSFCQIALVLTHNSSASVLTQLIWA
jgi:hypothetical protein